MARMTPPPDSQHDGAAAVAEPAAAEAAPWEPAESLMFPRLLEARKVMDTLAYSVAVLCAVDIILCIRILHVRTVFGLVFSVCGLFGSASRHKSLVLMYVIHTSFTFVRGMVHSCTIILAHANHVRHLFTARPAGQCGDALLSCGGLAAPHILSIFVLMTLEAIEFFIAALVYLFYSSVKDGAEPADATGHTQQQEGEADQGRLDGALGGILRRGRRGKVPRK
eukprot:TRINITY_DN56264_c0_g1_i1.p1 TRINITY_DN56264_c0_g1~~TRINITY_DN56264_c0_g1_i1.p1  ORF type:complete len:249 (+),score=75.84 TRINITY_DN56264_c0_g1_i1:79-747(+)